jgi:hypothetical protein
LILPFRFIINSKQKARRLEDPSLVFGEKGFQIITFGGRILRAETAAIAVAAVLQHRYGDLI